jgi:DNA-binding NarL/FixJ family response regulator
MQHRKPIRVLLCNKHNLFREGIKALFPGKTSFEIVGEAATAKQALTLLERVHPDVVLLDATTSNPSGSEATRRIKAIDSHVEVLILSLSDDDVLISKCLDAGAAGYIRKDDEPQRLKRAIDTAFRRGHRAA